MKKFSEIRQRAEKRKAGAANLKKNSAEGRH